MTPDLPLGAPAQEPQPPSSQLPLKCKLCIATLNVKRISQAGKREEIEKYRWISYTEIAFLCYGNAKRD